MAFWVPTAHSTAGSFVCSFPYGWLQQSLLFHLIGRGSELINPQLAAERSVSFIIFFYYYYLRMKQFKGNRRKKRSNNAGCSGGTRLSHWRVYRN